MVCLCFVTATSDNMLILAVVGGSLGFLTVVASILAVFVAATSDNMLILASVGGSLGFLTIVASILAVFVYR